MAERLSVASVATRTYPVPARLMEHPEKVIVPDCSVCEHPDSTAHAVPVLGAMLSATVELSLVTVPPLAF